MAKRKKIKTQELSEISKNIRWIYAFLFFGICLLYANTIGHDYTLDDAVVITENAYTKQGLSGLPEIFSYDTFRGFFQREGKDNLVAGGRYRPLSQAMFAVEYQIFGATPWIGHLGNVIWYGILVCSIFFVVHRISGKILLNRESAILIGSLTALLFGLHPIHTEVVANIKGRDEILSLLGCLWSLYFTLHFIKTGKGKSALLSGLFMFLAALSKENALAFIAVIPLTVFFFFNRNTKELFRATWPAFSGGILYLVVRFFVLGLTLTRDIPRELMNNPFLKLVEGHYIPMEFNEKYPLVIYGLFKYVQLLFFPHPLSHDYYPRVFGQLNWSSGMVVLGLLVLGFLVMIAYKSIRRQPLISYAIIYFGVTIFMTSNILFPIGTHISERFLFAPSLGFCLLLAGWLQDVYRKQNRTVFTFLLLLLTIPYTMKTISRNRVWENNYQLFTTDVKTSSGSAKVQNAAGGELISQAVQQQDTTNRRQILEEAISHLVKAIEIHPGYKNAYLLLGNARYYLKDYNRAIEFYDRALQLDPTYPEALYNRALAQRDLGRYYGERRGDLDKALEFLEKAYPQLQDDYEANRLLGIAYGNQGQPGEAIRFFKKALELKTDDAWANYNLGLAYLAMQDTANASIYIGRARSLNPEVGK